MIPIELSEDALARTKPNSCGAKERLFTEAVWICETWICRGIGCIGVGIDRSASAIYKGQREYIET